MLVTAKRLSEIGEYYFSQKLREIERMNQAGRNVLNLGIGSPDLPPHPEVIRALQESAEQPAAHKYQSYKGIPALRVAIAAWYLKWFNTTLQPETEILPLMGSKEGIMHICMTYLDAGDQALVPNPGYPTYAAGVKLAGAHAVPYLLSETNAWLPDLAALEKNDLRKVKLMFVNFPHMPTGTMPDDAFFKSLISFAQKHHILLVHDNPYGFILNEHPTSMLSFDGATSCVIELNSLSKSHNMAGWRVGMLCGAAAAIDEVLRFKSNMDSGMFLPVQLAAIKALQLERDWFDTINAEYAERKMAAASLLTLLQCSFSTEQKGMFLWGKVPGQYAHAEILSDFLLQKNAVFITPGSVFGDGGAHYLRISLCSPKSIFEEASQRIQTTL